MSSQRTLRLLIALLSGTVVLAVVCTWLIGPFLVELAHEDRFLSALRTRLGGPDADLESRLSIFYGYARLLTVGGLIAIVVLAHLAIALRSRSAPSTATSTPSVARSRRETALLSIVYAIVFLAGAYLLFVWPLRTYISTMADDTFLAFDAGCRLVHGQVPHVDFHTPMGAMTYVLPYWGVELAGRVAGSMEVASLLVAIMMVVLTLGVVRPRFGVVPTVLSTAFFVLMIVVPMNAGHLMVTQLSHAMYYNRYGWVGLTILFLYFVEPRRKSRSQAIVDVVGMTVLIAFLLYLKITYFLVGAVSLPVMALASRYNCRVVVASVSLLVLAVIGVELAYGLSLAYVRDITMAIKAGGSSRVGFIGTAVDNLVQVILVVMAALLVFRARRPTIAELAFVGLVFAGSLAILTQNAQTRNAVSLLVILLWSHERARRASETDSSTVDVRLVAGPTAAMCLLVLFVLPFIAFRSLAAVKYVEGTSRNTGLETEHRDGPLAEFGSRQLPAALDGITIGQGGSRLNLLAGDAASRMTVFYIARQSMERAGHPLNPSDYVESVLDGAQLLGGEAEPGESVIVFDMTNPFNVLLPLKPPHGDYAWVTYNVTPTIHLPAERVFADAEFVMVPKLPMNPMSRALMGNIYGSYVRAHYDVRAESAYWTLFARK